MTCTAKDCCKRLKLWAIVIFTAILSFFATIVLHEKYNRVDPNGPSLSVFGFTSTLSIPNCEVYSNEPSTTAECAKCASTWFISIDKTECQQEEHCNGID